MRIHLTDNKYLNSDEFQYWITSESIRKKDGKEITVKRMLTGYHGTNKGESLALENVFNDYFERAVRSNALDGEIADLVELIKKTRRDIHKWSKLLGEQLGGNK